MLVIKDTVKQFRNGQKTVGINAVKITETNHEFVKGILLRAAGDNDPTPNTNVIWIGGPYVTSSDGMPLAPGETMTLPLETAENLYAISTAASQNLAWWGA